MIIDHSFQGQTVQVPVGQVAELRLPENPTTGYRWAVTSAGDPSCNLAEQGYSAPLGPPGKGGEHVWRLTALAPGLCDIQLTYRRSFAPNAPGNSRFNVQVQVLPASR
jgi:inhibitor of cysteine peptidase